MQNTSKFTFLGDMEALFWVTMLPAVKKQHSALTEVIKVLLYFFIKLIITYC